MILLIIGGSGSGKSAYAEQRAAELGRMTDGRLLYLATMEPYDEESYGRIERHRQMRKDKNFITVECQTHLEEVDIMQKDTVLLECISNLTANEMYSEAGRKESVDKIIVEGIKKLAKAAENLIVVGNNVFEGGMEYEGSTGEYLGQMAEIQKEIANLADEVIEVVCGIPILLKGRSNK